MAMFRPWQISFLFHALVAASFVLLMRIGPKEIEIIQIPIQLEEPREVQNLAKAQDKPKVALKSVNGPDAKSRPNPTREVFGAGRRAHTDESVSKAEAVEAKKGSTLAKAADNKALLDSDPDSLPTPTEEYLVSEMPSVISEVRPTYPKKAKEQRLEGAVVMDILIDEKGEVRQASLVEGPEVFQAVALEAMRKFKFRPARVDGGAVAVKIRYTLRFELEY